MNRTTLLITSLALLFETAAAQSTELIGTWKDGRDGATYTLSSNGTFTWQGSAGIERGTYKASGNTIVFYIDGFLVGKGTISGNSLRADVGMDSFQGIKIGEPRSSSKRKSTSTTSSSIAIVNYDWCSPDCYDPMSAFRFSSDGTFSFSTVMFGGMTRRGTWKDIGNNKIVTSDNRIGTQTITILSKTRLKVGSTVYVRN